MQDRDYHSVECKPEAYNRSICPGCGLNMPVQPVPAYDGYFNVSPECWGVFTEVVGEDFSNAVLFGHAHQLTVDAYAVQHAGGPHPDKSVAVHLSGLYLAFEKGIAGPDIAPKLQKLVGSVDSWPVFAVPQTRESLTILDLALAENLMDRIRVTRAWAAEVWKSWGHAHDVIAGMLGRHKILMHP